MLDEVSSEEEEVDTPMLRPKRIRGRPKHLDDFVLGTSTRRGKNH
jgi:hypothetical protein